MNTKKILPIFGAILYCFLLRPNTSKAQTTNIDSLCKYIINNLNTGNYTQVVNLQNAEMNRKLSAENYESIWQSLVDKYDTLTSIGTTEVLNYDSFWVSNTVLNFVKKSVKLNLNFNKEKLITGIFIKPIVETYLPPTYVKGFNFVEYKIEVKTKGVISNGILSMPKKNNPLPLVIIVGGSGPTDMDGTVACNKPYKDIAWALAAKGVAVYRFDKRTVNKQNLANTNTENFGIEQEYLTDLKVMVQYFKKHPKINPQQIVIVGHSLGGYLLPYFAKNISNVAGFIGLAANYHGLLELLPMQLNYLDSLNGYKQKQETEYLIRQINFVKNNLSTSTINPDSMPLDLSQNYLLELENNCPQKLAIYLKQKPVLLVQGKRDYQVPYTETQAWQKSLPASCQLTTYLYDDLNHLLLEGKGTPNPTEYSKPANVPEYVIIDMVKWITNLPKPKRWRISG